MAVNRNCNLITTMLNSRSIERSQYKYQQKLKKKVITAAYHSKKQSRDHSVINQKQQLRFILVCDKTNRRANNLYYYPIITWKVYMPFLLIRPGCVNDQ